PDMEWAVVHHAARPLPLLRSVAGERRADAEAEQRMPLHDVPGVGDIVQMRLIVSGVAIAVVRERVRGGDPIRVPRWHDGDRDYSAHRSEDHESSDAAPSNPGVSVHGSQEADAENDEEQFDPREPSETENYEHARNHGTND